MRQELDRSYLLNAYQEADREVRLSYSKVGCILVLILVPAGSLLDFLVYERLHLVWPFFKIRLLVDVVTAGILALHFTAIGRRYVGLLGLSWVLVVNLAISWMIYASEGAVSPYYAGLNLVILAVGVLLPWGLSETLFACMITLAMYLTACLLHHLHHQTLIHHDILYNNIFFLALTAIICVTSNFFKAKGRFEDFRLRHELDVRNKELAEMDRLKSQFFANVNHELRTPLTLILSPVELLLHRDPPLDEEVGQALVMVKNNGLRLLKLINDMLEVIRLEEGGLMIEKQPIDLRTFVPGIVDSIRHLAARKGIELCADGDPQPLMIRGDTSRLEKVFLNLLSNAIKFTDPGGRIVTRWAGNCKYARVEVQDTGIGIAQDQLPHVFDRFRQADGSSTRKYQGVGLGLALCKELIEEHDGKLTATSEVGQGTTFVVELPLGLRGSHAGPETEPPDPDPPTDPFASTFRAADRSVPVDTDQDQADPGEVGSGDYRVLVVEDETDMRQFLVSSLMDEYRVLQAAEGPSGLDTAQQEQPDLVLLDLMLPGMDGLDVCRQLRKNANTRDIKIILLTARADDGSKIEALERGVDDFLTKPFSMVEVKTRIRHLLGEASLRRNLRQRNEELEQTLNRLQSTEAQLIQSEKMNALGSLAAGLLHEINNPLNYTITAAQLLRDASTELDDDAKDTLNDINEGMNRIRDIITDLRAFAYPEEADKRQRFDIENALDIAMRFTAHLRNGQYIDCDVAIDCPVLGSKSQISQVFVNLLVNALHAVAEISHRRHPVIRVTAQRSGERLLVKFWDNGVGIDPDVLSRIFDPFYTTREVGQGMGLGLSICHTIVKNHGGQIRVQSEKDEYTEVSLDLPLAPARDK